MATSSSPNVPVPQPCDIPGKRRFLIWRSLFEIDDRYEPIKAIGKGAYGVVCSATDKVTGEKVAIKKISDAFANVTDATRTLREIQLLRHLRHDNIIRVKDVPPPTSRENWNDVYVIYELIDTDLHQIIRSPQALSDEHFQYFLWQLLRSLKYIHSANILHRDIKPSNILLNATCDLKLCDFGLSRTGTTVSQLMTEYVVTRWYRAPELLLSCDTYGPAIDIWSVGCIMGELLTRRPMFTGKDYIDQIKLVVNRVGSPTEEELKFITSDRAREYIMRLPNVAKPKWAEIYPKAPPLALDLLDKMLQFDPARRITAAEALAHPYLASLHDPQHEINAPGIFHFDFDESNISESNIRDYIWAETERYAKMNAQGST